MFPVSLRCMLLAASRYMSHELFANVARISPGYNMQFMLTSEFAPFSQ